MKSIQISWLQVGVGIFSVQLLVFIVYIAVRCITDETPVVLSDEFAYYSDAVRTFKQFNLENLEGFRGLITALRHPIRPVFSWPTTVLLKLAGGTLNKQLLVLSNTAFYHIILAFSTYYILKLLGSRPLTRIAAISSIWAMPLFFDLSSVLLGDIAVAAWAILFLAVILTIQDYSYYPFKAFLIGIITALGLQTKPVFLMYFVTVASCLVTLKLVDAIFIRGKSYKVAIRKLLYPVVIFTLAFASLGYLIYPRSLQGLISEITYTNETLGYWVSQIGVFNSYLWFPTVILNEISIFPVFIFTLILLNIIVNSFKNLATVVLNKRLKYSLRNAVAQTCSSRGALVFLTFIFLVIYFSLFLKSKDSRTAFFLLPMFIFLSLYVIDNIGHHSKLNQKVYTFLVLSILVFNLNNTLSWSAGFSTITFQAFNKYLNLPSLQVYSKSPVITNVDTYEKLGVLDILKFIEKDCRPECTQKEPASVFIPHSSFRYSGESVFRTARYLDHDINESFTFADIDVPFNFFSQTFSYGGWGTDGGIPKNFFIADYIVLVKDYLIGQLPGNTEVYNKLITKELSANKHEFIDGLVKIHQVYNRLGDQLIVYKRQRLPSTDSFVEIVQTLTERDPNNLWNVPFIYTALQINSQLPGLQKQLEEMSKTNFLKRVRYHYGNPEQEVKIKALLTKPINTNKQEENVKYPTFLTNW